MRIVIDRDSLAPPLSAASRATPPKSSSSLFPAAVHLTADNQGLHASATDGDLGITILVPSVVDLDETGEVLAPAKLLTSVVAALPPGPVTLATGPDGLQVASARSRFVLPTFPLDNAVTLPPVDGPSLEVPSALLRASLAQVLFAAASEPTRPVLTGVLLEAQPDGLRLVATDTYRLALRDVPGLRVPGADRARIIVPSRALAELQRLLWAVDSVQVHLGAHQVAFDVGPAYLTARLIDGVFPPYEQLIPQEPPPYQLTVEAEPLTAAIKRVALVAAGDRAVPVRVTLTSEGAQVAVLTSDGAVASEQVEAKYEGEEGLTLGFNPAYLAEGLSVLSTGTAVIGLTNPTKTVLLRELGEPGDDANSSLQLLMPVKIV